MFYHITLHAVRRNIYYLFFFFAHYQSSVTVWPLQGPRALMPSPVLVAQVAGSD